MMVYKDRLTRNWTIFFIVISIVLGLAVNTMGFVGLLPIIAIVQITLCNFYLKTIRTIKTGFIINSAIYVVYFLAILDFSSAVIESFTALVGIVSLYRLLTGDSNE